MFTKTIRANQLINVNIKDLSLGDKIKYNASGDWIINAEVMEINPSEKTLEVNN